MSTDISSDQQVVLVDVPEERSAALHTSLAAAGFETTAVDSAAECFRLLDADSVGGVVCGFELESTDGLTLLGSIREEYPSLPVVLFPADGSEELAGDALAAGASGYVPSSSSPEAAVERLRDFLSDPDRGESEHARRYQNLVENAPIPIDLFDAEGTILWGNDAILEFLGLDDRAELVGRSIFEFVHPEDRSVATEELADVVERGHNIGSTRLRVVRDDGTIRHARVSTAAGRFEGRRVGQALVVDDTPLQEIESELRAERDLLQGSIDALGDLFFLADADGRLCRWNARVPEVMGYDDAELDGMSLMDFVPPDQVRAVAEVHESVLSTGSATASFDLQTRGGDRLNYEFNSARIDHDGDVRVVGIGHDVTERERLLAKSRDDERRYRTLVEMSPDPILVNVDGDVVFANDAFADLVGADSPADVHGTHITRYLAESEHANAKRTTRETSAGPANRPERSGSSSPSTARPSTSSRPLGPSPTTATGRSSRF